MEKEDTSVITIRLPRSLHQRLRKESFRRETSMNQLCIEFLLRPLKETLAGGGTDEQTRPESGDAVVRDDSDRCGT